MDPVLAIVAISEAVKSICEVTAVIVQNMTDEQKKVHAELQVEMMKPFIEALKFFNRQFERQLEK